MKKFIALFLVLVLCLSLPALSLSAFAEDKVVTVYTWAEMFPPEVLNAFEEETGYKINYVNFDYDVIIADDYIIERAVAEGLLQKLDKEKILNYDNINPIYQGQFYDPQDEYTVPYGAGVQTITYNPSDDYLQPSHGFCSCQRLCGSLGRGISG